MNHLDLSDPVLTSFKTFAVDEYQLWYLRYGGDFLRW